MLAEYAASLSSSPSDSVFPATAPFGMLAHPAISLVVEMVVNAFIERLERPIPRIIHTQRNLAFERLQAKLSHVRFGQVIDGVTDLFEAYQVSGPLGEELLSLVECENVGDVLHKFDWKPGDSRMWSGSEAVAETKSVDDW